MLWQPDESRIQRSEMYRFMQVLSREQTLAGLSYAELYQYSIEHPGEFWVKLIQHFHIITEGDLAPAVTDLGFENYGWFPNVQLNYAQNLLAAGQDDMPALVGLHENGSRNELSYAQLRHSVAEFQNQIRDIFSSGDVLACYMPNLPETAIAMLASTGLGGVFTSTSSDFGLEGVTDRFGQSRPKVLVACAAYQYNGKTHDCLAKIEAVVAAVPSIERVYIVDFLGLQPDISHIENAVLWQVSHKVEVEPEFVARAFNDPLYIMYSSGTTGKPKCIVHSVGGSLLQHIKELALHSDFGKNKNMMFFTTCGWMMWNWQISALFFGGTVTLYEGSPAYPSIAEFFGLIDAEKLTHFGTSPKFLKVLEDRYQDIQHISLSSLEVILSTGSPLLPEQYDFVYQTLKSDVLLASISGGTDILGCFFLGNPVLPVYRGELQCKGLGMDVVCIDADGQEVVGKEGELVCKQSFPSRPIYFLADPNNEKLNAAYFEQMPGKWFHGDFIQLTEHGGALFFGRSDATLNPGGVRIGTSEIYRQTETLAYIEDAVCVGKQVDGDVDVMLFVKLHDGESLNDERVQEIKSLIRANTTPRHVPKQISAVVDIPYTRSGKKIELAVTRIVNGKAITNKEAIANPECLVEYEAFAN